MNILIYLYLISLPICFILNLGFAFAYWRGRFPDELKFTFVTPIFFVLLVMPESVFGVFVIWFLTNSWQYGWKFPKLSK